MEVLQENLEIALDFVGYKPSSVFRDATDVGAGRSWVPQLQQALDSAQVMILVATPESMASPRVHDEWQSLIARRDDWWSSRLLVVQLVDCPIPSFLESSRVIDFREHDEKKYRQGLQRVLAGVLSFERSHRSLPELPARIAIPETPIRPVPTRLRNQLVDWLKGLLSTRVTRSAVASALDLETVVLTAFPSVESAASAVLVECTGEGDPIGSLLSMLDRLEQLLGEDLPDKVEELRPLRAELEELGSRIPSSGSGGRAPTIFVSYSRADGEFLERLQVHLRPLEMASAVEFWDDSRIEAGERWRQEISAALDRAVIAILLVSADFLASEFILQNELPPLLQAAEERGTTILPVILKHCRFSRDERLSVFQAVNDPANPLQSMRESDREKVWDTVSAVVEKRIFRSG